MFIQDFAIHIRGLDSFDVFRPKAFLDQFKSHKLKKCYI